MKLFSEFCKIFDGFVLAEGSYKTYEFHQALLYLEQHMAITKKDLSNLKERDLLVVSLFSSKKIYFFHSILKYHYNIYLYYFNFNILYKIQRIKNKIKKKKISYELNY